MPVIPAHRRLSGRPEFKASFGYIARPSFKIIFFLFEKNPL
jgi:hypothetical protein